MRRNGNGGTDPYVPGHGDAAYGVEHYDLQLAYALGSNRLDGVATITLVVHETTSRLRLDLIGLRTSKVRLEGAQLAGHQQRPRHLVVRTKRDVEAGTRLTLTITYAGSPTPAPGPDGRAGWEELDDGVIVASQPHGAPSWFPCNDRPSDKASYRFRITTAPDHHVVANGRLVGKSRGASGRTWEYEQVEPMATYLATVQVGRYVVRSSSRKGVEIIACYPRALEREVEAAFDEQRAMLAAFVERFGPYPFGSYTVVVTPDVLEIPVEAQTLSIFGSNHLSGTWEHERLVAHELAHQWFGNSLTLEHWRDIWLHEGFACYSEWLWSEASGRRPAHAIARRHWQRLAGLPQDIVVSNPGAASMFDDRVYKRGALTLHALRLSVGDQPFFDLVRSWVATHRHGSVTDAAFRAHVRDRLGDATAASLSPWLDTPALPPLPSLPA